MSPAQDMDLSNETLVAYIDGELSADEQARVAEALRHDDEAQERLDLLKRGGRAFDEAFDGLLAAAPERQLQAMFSDLVAKKTAARPGGGALDQEAGAADETVVPLRRPQRTRSRPPLWQMAAAAAILVFVFAGGMVTGGLFGPPAQVGEEQVGWREAAARYVALFSAETLAGFPDDPGQRQANLQKIETALGLPLSDERISNPQLAFKGTQLLQLRDKPLAQISYLHDGRTPVALCIIRSGKDPAAPDTEQRQGLNVVHWIAEGYGFMVIGDVPEPELRQISEEFRQRFS